MIVENATPPKKRQTTLSKVTKVLVIPLALALMNAWNEYRAKQTKQLTENSYEASVPVVKEIQAKLTDHDKKIELLQQLGLVQSEQIKLLRAQLRAERHGYAAPAEVNPAVDSFSNNLVVKVQKSQGAPAIKMRLPEHLDDVPTKK